MKLSEKTLRALKILADYPGINAKAFAHKMWPDSLGWHRSYRCGPNGTARGMGMWLTAGSYLSRLESNDLVKREMIHGAVGFELAKLGLEIIKRKFQ